mgnify:CR=1 FL=1
MASKTRSAMEELLKLRGWEKSKWDNSYCWLIPGFATKPPGRQGYAGSLLEAVRQQIELEEGACGTARE